MSLLNTFGLTKSKPRKKHAADRNRRLWQEPLEKRDMLTLLGIVPDFPITTYNSTGHIHYDPGTHNFDLTATPLAFKASSASDPTSVDPPASLSLHIQVDNAGHLIGGVSGDDFVVEGAIDDGTINVSGVLLRGEIADFGFAETGATDVYDFRFTVTGGLLASLFAGKDIGVTTTSEQSTFNDSFEAVFDGGAKGNIGAIDPVVVETGSISGHKFRDKKGDGITPDDVPLGGVTIQLFKDGDGNGQFDPATEGTPVATTVTEDGTGAYSFTGLAPGIYFVKEQVPPGSKQTFPATEFYTVTVTPGSNTTDLDFANQKKCKPNPCDDHKPCEPRLCDPKPCDSKNSCKTPPPCGQNDNNHGGRGNSKDCKSDDRDGWGGTPATKQGSCGSRVEPSRISSQLSRAIAQIFRQS